MKIEFNEFQKAYETLKTIIDPTPMVLNEWLSKQYDCQVYLKLENKSLETAQLYFNLQFYNAAIIAYKNLLKDL